MDQLLKVCKVRGRRKLGDALQYVISMPIGVEDKVAMVSMLLYALSAPCQDDRASDNIEDYVTLAILLLKGIGYEIELPETAAEPSLILRP